MSGLAVVDAGSSIRRRRRDEHAGPPNARNAYESRADQPDGEVEPRRQGGEGHTLAIEHVIASATLCAMWRERILRWTDEATFRDPASDEAILACEAALGQRLPRDLADLLRETNGVEGEYGLGLIWPIERIREDNLMFRLSTDFAGLYMPFEPMLFFADAGNGDQFAFVIRDRPADVFVWDHETDSRSMVAPNLATYLERWLDGQILV
jgi:SMI1-KNR4 cell-wall